MSQDQRPAPNGAMAAALRLLSVAGALRKLGRDADAAATYGRAALLAPGLAAAHYNLGNTLRDLGRLEAAIGAYQRAAHARPAYPQALNNLGAVLRDLGRNEAALEAYRQVVELCPDAPNAHYNLGNALRALGCRPEAISAYERALALAPDHAAALNNLGNTLHELGRMDAAAAAYRRALELRPANQEARLNLAEALLASGQASEALMAVDEVLATDPASARGWFIRSNLKTFAPGEADLARLEALADASDDAGVEIRLNLDFAAAKAWMDVGEAGLAFAHLTRANRLKRASLDYDVRADEERFARLAAAFTPETMARLAGAGEDSDLPVFVVGMPRSGTTLVEQILASHGQVQGAGELACLDDVVGDASEGEPLAERIASLPRGDLARLGGAYLDHVRPLAEGKPRLVDKMPANFAYCGLILLMLPNAKIIHCRRDPRDTCLSCYSKKFSGDLDFTYDLTELGLYWRAYDGLMTHWRALLPPDRFMEVQYEALVDDLEGQARRMVAFLGLGWDQACLAFQETRRPVRTASASQVRQPLFRTSVGRWRAYLRHLSPLLEALGPAWLQ